MLPVQALPPSLPPRLARARQGHLSEPEGGQHGGPGGHLLGEAHVAQRGLGHAGGSRCGRCRTQGAGLRLLPVRREAGHQGADKRGENRSHTSGQAGLKNREYHWLTRENQTEHSVMPLLHTAAVRYAKRPQASTSPPPLLHCFAPPFKRSVVIVNSTDQYQACTHP